MDPVPAGGGPQQRPGRQSCTIRCIPAVLLAIRQVVEGGQAAGKPVGVCGEMAGDPASALLLMAMGVDSLSMNLGSLLKIKWMIRKYSL